MELWIRSQSKMSLVDAGNLVIFDIDENWVICKLNSSLSINYRIELGTYKSKERALEILDEIQSILMPKCIINSKYMKFSKPYEENGIVLMDCNADVRLEQLSTYVYEMPEE